MVFKSYMRPMIVVDATHLTGVYKGKIYTVVCADGNSNIFPLAFSFSPEKYNNTWEWFMRRLRGAFGNHNDLVIVLDRHKGIRHAVKVVYPGVPHAFCYYHMKGNIKQFCRSTGVIDVFRRAMYAYRVEDCERYLDELRRMQGKVYSWLTTGIRRERWARSYCPKSRWNHMTSNFIESFNQAIKKDRKILITAAHEFYLALVQRWFNKHRQNAESMMGSIT